MKVTLRSLLLYFMVLLACWQTTGQTFIHYWNSNNSTAAAALLTPGFTVGRASIMHLPGGLRAIQTTNIAALSAGLKSSNPQIRNF